MSGGSTHVSACKSLASLCWMVWTSRLPAFLLTTLQARTPWVFTAPPPQGSSTYRPAITAVAVTAEVHRMPAAASHGLKILGLCRYSLADAGRHQTPGGWDLCFAPYTRRGVEGDQRGAGSFPAATQAYLPGPETGDRQSAGNTEAEGRKGYRVATHLARFRPELAHISSDSLHQQKVAFARIWLVGTGSQRRSDLGYAFTGSASRRCALCTSCCCSCRRWGRGKGDTRSGSGLTDVKVALGGAQRAGGNLERASWRVARNG